jgi:hypothetical protein
MDLTFNQADFLMHCIEVFVLGNGNEDAKFEDAKFTDIYGNVLLDNDEITEVFLKIQELKFAAPN